MPPRFVARHQRTLAAALLSAFCAAAASAQINAPNQLLIDGSANGGVSVHDSAVAVDRMALAVRLEGEKEWKKSAEVYQEIIEKYPDRVVPSATDDQGVINQYISVLKRVDEHLRAWPPEGLAVYDAHYELAAQTLLQAAAPTDLAPLHEVFTRYFITDSGKQAGLKLIDAYFEMGDFAAATWIGQELLGHPELLNDRPKVLFRLGLAALMSGDEASAQKSLQELKDKFPAVTGTIAGRDVTLADELAGDIGRLHPSDSTTSQIGESSPMFGGNPSRDRTYSSAARPGAKLYSVALSQPDWKSVNDPNTRDFQATEDGWRKLGAATGVIPVTDRDELYFQDNSHLYALSLQTGNPLPAWHATYPDHAGEFILSNSGPGAGPFKPWNMPIGHQFTVTLTDSAVLAVMALPDPLARSFEGDQGGVLVCLDRATGKTNWTVAARNLADPNLKSLDFESSPLVVGNNVFLAARGARGNGDEDCQVICFDLNTGALRWSCFVASGTGTEQAFVDATGRTLPVADFYAHLAYAGGRVFVSTNLGAVAALDAYSGDIDWVNIYRDPGEGVNQGLIMPGRGFRGGFRGGFGGGPFGGGNFIAQDAYAPPTPWTANPPIVHDGNVFVLPDDGKYILVYDAGDGHVVKKLNKSDCCQTKTESDPPQTLVGLLDGAIVNDNGQRVPKDLLFVATKNCVVAIKWREYNPADHSASIAWATSHGGADRVLGRPFLTTQNVYIPSSNSLYRVDIRNGKVAEYYPASSTWPSDEGPGNVLVCGSHVVIAGDQRVNVYTDLSVAKTRLDQEVSAASADPGTRLHYAEVMFLANQPALAAQKLDEAVALLGADDTARRRAFNDALEFAVRNWLHGGPPADSAGLFGRATKLARDPEERVKCLMARARFARFGQNDPGQAIRLCQEIFPDTTLTSAMVVADFLQPAPPPIQPGDEAQVPAGAASDHIFNQPGAPLIQPAYSGAQVPAVAVIDRIQAGSAAEKMIAAILHDPNGAAAYAPIELAAASEAASAAAAQNPDRLALAARDYPNSSIAPSARQKAADLYEARGDYASAVRMLREIYAKVNDDNQRLVLLEAMTRNDLHLPDRLQTAASRLIGAIRLDSRAAMVSSMRLPNGQVISHLKLIDALNKIDLFIDAASPATAIPPNAGPPSAGRPNTGLANAGQPNAAQPNTAQRDRSQTNAGLPDIGLPAKAVKQAYYIKYNQTLTDIFVPDPASVSNVGVLLSPPQPWARYDRIAAWTSGAGISIYRPGTRQPLATNADFTDEPAGAAWVNGRTDLLAWGASSVMLVSGDKPSTRWRIDLTTLPHLDVVAQAAAAAAQPSLIQPINQMQLRRMTRQMPVANQPLFVLGRNDAPASAPDDTDTAGAAPILERVTSVTPATSPATGVAIIATNTGRAAAVDIASGHILWEFRLAGRTLDRVLVSDDFTVLKASDSASVHLAVLDTHTGRLLSRRDWAADEPAAPVNIALGDDGSFAYTTIDAVNIFDLFEADHDSGMQSPAFAIAPQGNSPFTRMSRPDQLLIDDGMVVALSDLGRMLRGYSLRSGQPREVGSQHGLTEGIMGGTEESTLRADGKYLYVWGPAAIEGIDLNNLAHYWTSAGWNGKGLAQQLMLGKDFLLVFNQPFGQVKPTNWWISAFSRATVPPANTESGLLLYQLPKADDSGILSWQLVDGGICYLTGDHVLHLLRGNANPAPPAAPVNKPAP